jgi:peptide deformylase
MPILDVLHFPDPRLRTTAKAVAVVDDSIRQIVDDMFATMYGAPGIGLAATQVDIHKRIVVIDVSENKDQPLCLINPQIIDREGEQEWEEGCLSLPDQYEKVQRAEFVKVRFQDRKGNLQELEAHELLAICVQHEIDHLNGKLFVDYLSSLKRNRIRKKLEKMAKQEQAADAHSGVLV